MFKGLPGSGKDTKAKELMKQNPGAYKRVNKDSLRKMLDFSKHSKGNERFVLKIRDNIIIEALQEGKHVLCTDTNLQPLHETRLKEIAKEYETVFKVIDLTHTDVETCIERDLKRKKSVGEKVIRSMYNQYLRPKIKEYTHNPNLNDCIICDLDGTLALFGDKNPYDRDFENDIVNESVEYILRKYTDTPIIIVSGRSDIFREVTGRWLENHGIKYDLLYMRKEGDSRKDCIIKREIFELYIRDKYNPILVLDDRDSTVKLWRDLGLTCFQVKDGDF